MSAEPGKLPATVHLPGGPAPALLPYLRTLWGRRDLIWALSTAQVEAAHANTVLGRLWTVVNPLALGIAYYLLVVIIRGGDRQGALSPATIIGGMFVFAHTRSAVVDAHRSLLRHAQLVLNTAIPRAIPPLAGVVTAMRLFAPAVVVYALIHFVAGRPVTPWLLLLVPILGLQLVLNVGVALLTAVATVHVRDVGAAIHPVLRIWLYASPVIWAVGALPDDVRWILHANPIGSLLGGVQLLLEGGRPSADLVPSMVVWPVMVCALGTWVFLRKERRIALLL